MRQAQADACATQLLLYDWTNAGDAIYHVHKESYKQNRA